MPDTAPDPQEGRAYDERGNVRPADPRWLETDEADEDGTAGYEVWTVDELKDELSARGLPRTGNKPDLVARLTTHDQEGPAQS